MPLRRNTKKNMIFISESRLIFKVQVNGVDKLVAFSEPGNGNSTFETNKREVAEAIRKHKFYRQGKIREFGSLPDEAAPAPIVKDSEEILEFGSFSQLKSYLKKTFGDEAKSIKTPAQVKKFASDKGVSYRFTEQ